MTTPKTFTPEQWARLLRDLPDRLNEIAEAMKFSRHNHRQMAGEALREAAYAIERANRHLAKDLTIDADRE